MKKIIIVLLFTFTNIIYAGFNGLTYHSRANCVNNESISWDWTHDWTLHTISNHEYVKNAYDKHTIDTGWETTWRNGAVHWGEGTGNFRVLGKHYINKNNKIISLGSEYVQDCSIYDGWWDKNKN